MPKTRYAPFPDYGTHEPAPFDVVIPRRHLEAVIDVEQRRRQARADRVWIALTTATGKYTIEAPIAADLLDTDGGLWPCGHLSEEDAPGWRRLLRLSVRAGVTWIWPATIIEPDPGSWRVTFYH